MMSVAVALAAACGGGTSSNSAPGSVDPNETAASVNGKVIKMEDVERAVKQQAQGQESKLSPLELAGARLQVLQGLIEQEVMFQKAEKEGVVPKDEDVAAEINRQKVESRLSVEEFDRQMKQAGLDEQSYKEQIKRGMAIKALVDKVTMWFVPAVFAVAALTFAAWLWFGPSPALTFALVNAVAVLIIACPCAMGLATPTAIMVGTGRGAELGILFRKGEALQLLKDAKVVAVDKTGTLTEGRPALTDLQVTDGFDRATVASSASGGTSIWRASSARVSARFTVPCSYHRRGKGCRGESPAKR